MGRSLGVILQFSTGRFYQVFMDKNYLLVEGRGEILPRELSRSRSDNRLEVSQAAFKVFSHHAVATGKNQEKLEEKRRLAVHGPGHNGLGTFGLQRELLNVGALERLAKVELTTDKVVCPAFRDGHFARAGFAVAFPGEVGAGAGSGAAVGQLHVGIELGPWRPFHEFVQVVHERENLCRRPWNGRLAMNGPYIGFG